MKSPIAFFIGLSFFAGQSFANGSASQNVETLFNMATKAPVLSNSLRIGKCYGSDDKADLVFLTFFAGQDSNYAIVLAKKLPDGTLASASKIDLERPSQAASGDVEEMQSALVDILSDREASSNYKAKSLPNEIINSRGNGDTYEYRQAPARVLLKIKRSNAGVQFCEFRNEPVV